MTPDILPVSTPEPEPLRFPRGVRFPHPDEIPRGGPPTRALPPAPPQITTGYRVATAEGRPYSALIEANVHADRVWHTVQALSRALLPSAAAPIVGIGGEDPVLGPYTDREVALAVFEPYVDALQHDGFLEFGIIFQYQGRTEEVFVRAAKYVQVWTNRPETARRILEECGVPPVPDLQFIDEFPRVSESLCDSAGNAGWPPVLDGLRAAFATLPQRRPPPSVT